jgi:hypothetical protein
MTEVLSGSINGNHERLQLGQQVVLQRFEPVTSRIQPISVTACAKCSLSTYNEQRLLFMNKQPC